jgi:hypothetical protein
MTTNPSIRGGMSKRLAGDPAEGGGRKLWARDAGGGQIAPTLPHRETLNIGNQFLSVPRERGPKAPSKVELFSLLYNGQYETAREYLDDDGKRRLRIVEYLELRVNGKSVADKDNNEVYRGYSAKTSTELQAVLDDPTPFENSTPEGGPKNPENDLLETYLGCYVTSSHDQAHGYAQRYEYGIIVTFDWRKLRANYVQKEISFEVSNDIAYATEDFSDPWSNGAEIINDLKRIMPDDHPVHQLDEDTITKEEFYDKITEPENCVPWSFFFGRNKELAIEGMQDWSWDQCKSFEKISW